MIDKKEATGCWEYIDNSILVTRGNCEFYGAYREIRILMAIYPDGVLYKDLIYNLNTPKKILRWMYEKLPITDEDKKLYLQFMSIEDSHSFFNCKNIYRSWFISDSINIYDSSDVDDGQYIWDSSEIRSSRSINNSTKIVKSNQVARSEMVIKSNDIEQSKDILRSSNVTSSDGVAYSKDISYSSYLVRCRGVERSFFCSDLVLCSNKIFCNHLHTDTEPMIFNKPVSKIEFDRIKALLLSLLSDAPMTITMGNIIDDMGRHSIPSEAVFYLTLLNNSHLILELQELIPNFDEELFYQITNYKAN